MFDKLFEGKISQIILSSSIAFFLGCCGLSIFRSSDVNIEAANTRINLSTQVNKTKAIATSLTLQAQDLESDRSNYQALKEKYDRLLARSNSSELRQISPEIEKISQTQRSDIESDIASTTNEIEQLEQTLADN